MSTVRRRSKDAMRDRTTAKQTRELAASTCVAVIDIGSNTGRLLVARQGKSSTLVGLRNERVVLGLGHEIECTGAVSAERLKLTMRWGRRFAALARAHGAVQIDVVVTAPGRQAANADALVAGLARATGLDVRVLSGQEEGRYAFHGATAGLPNVPKPVAVCDVGGGSTEVAIGAGSADRLISIDIGCLRLKSRFLTDDPPSRRAVKAATQEVRTHLDSLGGVGATTALATGGSARALGKVVGRTLDRRHLDRAIQLAARKTAKEITRDYGLHAERARVLLAGAILLRQIHDAVGVPLEVANGGLREGIALSLLQRGPQDPPG
jgi:exopolyphosphatase/guanosine-5'-triphosphate,3'-diphosphate pyrophosphatase